MGVVTINAKDGNGTPVSLGDVDLSYGLEITTIDKTLSWTLTATDNEPSTTSTDFIGGRPDDR